MRGKNRIFPFMTIVRVTSYCNPYYPTKMKQNISVPANVIFFNHSDASIHLFLFEVSCFALSSSTVIVSNLEKSLDYLKRSKEMNVDPVV